ncbi:MAG: hypothetical protein HC806_02520 [Anaerolineae bacterium]|nr:hypothetical protein [Anaerolineae bacterium]
MKSLLLLLIWKLQWIEALLPMYSHYRKPLDQLDPEMKGFGAPANNQNSPAYTEIAALPSAKVTVKVGENDLGEVGLGKVGK